jgi:hypothetical protein
MQWIANVLRGESGAAISLGEYQSSGALYWPRPGDDEAALKRKKAAREQKVDNLLLQGGPQGAKYWQNQGYQLPKAVAKQYGMETSDADDYLDNILSSMGVGSSHSDVDSYISSLGY